jgi:uncharacterized membrane protein YhhN
MFALFVLLGVGNIVSVVAGWQWGIYLTKPLLMPALAVWFFQNTKQNAPATKNSFLAGLGFSALGDVLLMLVSEGGEHLFLFGLGSFLVAHLCYITAFTKYPGLEKGLVRSTPWTATLLVIYLFVLLGLLWNGLTVALKIPVILYGGVITAMAISCLNMSGRVNRAIAAGMFRGAILFVLSDSAIALKKFVYTGWPDAATSVFIMVTYILGQFLLAKGVAEAINEIRQKKIWY